MVNAIRLAFLANGKSLHVKRWLGYFAGRGYDVHLITFVVDSIEGVTVHKVSYFNKMAYVLRIHKVREAIKRIKPDILHAHYISVYGVYGSFLNFHPFLLSTWGDDVIVDPRRSMFHGLLIRYAIKKADLVHSGSEIVSKQLIKLGCDPKKIFMQLWGVDNNFFSPKARSEDLRRELGGDNGCLVLCARRWKPSYHVNVLIKAIPFVVKEVRNVKFIMLGGGPLKSKLVELAQSLKVLDKVLFVGRVPDYKMPKYLASVDVYVDTISDYYIDPLRSVIASSGRSGAGQTTREAMACGTPQLISDVLDVRTATWFRGLTYRQLDPRDLAEKLILLLKDEGLRRRISRESRMAALKFFDLKKNMQKIEKIYDSLL